MGNYYEKKNNAAIVAKDNIIEIRLIFIYNGVILPIFGEHTVFQQTHYRRKAAAADTHTHLRIQSRSDLCAVNYIENVH